MHLFKVHISWETVIRAKDYVEAEKLAERVIRDGDDEHAECASSAIKSIDDLPTGWDAECRPWGETDPMDRTIGEILKPHPAVKKDASMANSEPYSMFLVDCNVYGDEPLEYATITEALAENRILEITVEDDGRFRLCEMCDKHFVARLTREQLIAWSEELRALADPAESKTSTPDERI